MDPHWTDPDQPINGVSWYEAAQFVNWLNISTGHQAAYKFTGTQGTSSYALATWSVEEAACGGTNLYRHKEAFYYLPTENEWVKAAYWNGVDLQTYATKNNGTPGEWRPTGGPSSDGQAAGWNYGHAYPSNTSATGQPWEVTEGYSPEELNGTFDMMGNVWEWTESPYDDTDFETDSSRAVRGGSHYDYRVKLESPSRTAYGPDYESSRGGFRVAAVPEPASLALVLLGGLALVVKGKRR